MTERRRLVHTAFLFALPIIVAAFGWSVWTAVLAVLLMLLWHWAITLSGFIIPEKQPPLVLDSISASHFVEKVRWCLDRLGLPYRERQVGGTLGVFFLGRTVPLLKFRSGAVRSSIGNSPEILRYLWGRYAAERPDQAEFLRPTPERLAFEAQIDRCGANLQVWVYHHILPHRDLTLHAWGAGDPAVPVWQRWLLRLLFPVLRRLIRFAFRISPARQQRAVEHVSALLAEVEEKLADGRASILGGEALNFSDFAFAAIMGLWAQPAGYGGGRADAVRLDLADCPPQMQAEIEAWRRDYPRASDFVERLYSEHRGTAGGRA